MTDIPSSLNPYQIFEEAELWHKICEEIDWEKDKKFQGSILAWNREETPIYYGCIVAIFEQNNQYALTYLCQTKKYKWHTPVICDADIFSSIVEFKQKPTEDDLIQFLQNAVTTYPDFANNLKINHNVWYEITNRELYK